MASSKIINIILLVLIPVMEGSSFFLTENSTETYMSREEKANLKLEAVEMFYHAYNAYMNNAYPADELMPLSCKGRYRNSQPSRGNVDEALGNFSLTLIDTLDTLVILGDFDEFERAIKLVIKDVNFNTDVVVSVFETNIRVLGGLLSAHVLADALKLKHGRMTWYNNELLALAKDLGTRLLPAFNTVTGIPYGRVNLKYGIRDDLIQLTGHTCTACAGTMILEMAALSRLTGNPIFEQKAHKAMDELWSMRHRTSNLMGTILDVHSGDWVRKESGVGAGIDSYYEYCLKAYILLSDEKYLRRFNTHYSAVMTYVSQGPMLLDVHMHRPNTNSKNFMDALLAFWPGLQVLKGDLKPAIETHEMLYQVMQRYKFIPEAFTTDFQIHWGQHPLRPEFVESTYFLYRATGDHYYLHVGRNVLKSLQKYARVPCGYASFEDVRTRAQEDSMDSFVLAETFKYLFLLFAEPSDTAINLDDYLFTTEAHLLPLSISRYSSPNHSQEIDGILMLDGKNEKIESDKLNDDDTNIDMSRSCVIPKYVVGHFLRQNLRNMFEGICPQRKFLRKLHASQFQSSNKEHVRLLKDMGITVVMLSDGKIQLVHNYLTAASKSEAKEGALFMQEIVELSKTNSVENTPQAVSFPGENGTVILSAGPAHFGKLFRVNEKLTASVGVAEPLRACEPLKNAEMLKNRIVLVERGDCMFVDKARKLEKAGAKGGIVVDNTPDTSADSFSLFTMSGDGVDNVNIPVVFLFTREARTLIAAVTKDPLLQVTLSQLNSDKTEGNRVLDAPLENYKGFIKEIVYKPVSEQGIMEKLHNKNYIEILHMVTRTESKENFVEQNDQSDEENIENGIIPNAEDEYAIEQMKEQLQDYLEIFDALYGIVHRQKIVSLVPDFNKIHVFSVLTLRDDEVMKELVLIENKSQKRKEKYEELLQILSFAHRTKRKMFIEIKEHKFLESKVDYCELEKKYMEIKKTVTKYSGTPFLYDTESTCQDQKLAMALAKKDGNARRVLKIKVNQEFLEAYDNEKKTLISVTVKDDNKHGRNCASSNLFDYITKKDILEEITDFIYAKIAYVRPKKSKPKEHWYKTQYILP